MSMQRGYPLEWPPGWPRTPSHSRSNSSPFKTAGDKGLRELFLELKRFGAEHVVLSSNVPIRSDGMPYADAARRKIDDPGVALYFTLKGKAMSMARDKYWRTEDNIRSICKTIEAMRAIERNGGDLMMEKAFDGFAALPPPEKPKRPWWVVMGYSPNAEDREGLSDAEIDMRYRTLAKKRHPDHGGSAEAFNELTEAKAEALADTTR